MWLEGFKYHQQNGSNEDHYWKLVEPTIKNMAVGIPIGPKIFKYAPTPKMIENQHDDKNQFGQEPATASSNVITEPQPRPK